MLHHVDCVKVWKSWDDPCRDGDGVRPHLDDGFEVVPMIDDPDMDSVM